MIHHKDTKDTKVAFVDPPVPPGGEGGMHYKVAFVFFVPFVVNRWSFAC